MVSFCIVQWDLYGGILDFRAKVACKICHNRDAAMWERDSFLFLSECTEDLMLQTSELRVIPLSS